MNIDAYAIVIVPLSEEDGRGFIGIVPDLPGCMSDGETSAEALENTRDAMAAWLNTAQEMKRDIPEPGRAANKSRQRDKAFVEAMKAAMSALDAADGRIAHLEHQMGNLVALLELESDRRIGVVAASVTAESRLTICH